MPAAMAEHHTLVTGASGHVGANLIRHLAEHVAPGDTLHALVRKTTDRKTLAGLPVSLIEGDLLDPGSLANAMQGCTRVYHAAARISTVQGREQDLYDTNVLGTRHVLDAARNAGVQRVVVTSSLGAVGQPKGRPCNEDDGFNPYEHHLPYEESKAWVEHECLKACVEGLDVVIVVSTAVLGPYDYVPSRMGRVIKDYANGKLNAYIPGGFEFVGAGDLARGHVLAMERGRSGQRYIVSGQYLSVDDLMSMLQRITGVPKPKLRLPAAVMLGIAHVTTPMLVAFSPGTPLRFTPDAVRLLQMQRKASIEKARKELGYAPRPIEDALRDAYAWFVEHGVVSQDHAIRSAS
jgi:nucleoside-diphosphate-sugar epimerase